MGVLILVRHGRTGFNAAGRLVGRLDPPLDEVGLAQAAAIGDALKGMDRVIASPLLRARQTAEYIGAPVEVDERWIEVDYGVYDGVELGTAGGGRAVGARGGATPRSCRSAASRWCRWASGCRRRCEELVKAAADADIAVVSHVSPIKAAVSWVLHADAETAWRSHLDQASISRIAITPRGAVLRSFNETWHLT